MTVGVTIADGTAAGITTIADGKPGTTIDGIDAIPTIADSCPGT